MNDDTQCVYCGQPATTKDHVPPKGIFPPPRPSSLITVPSCLTCNNTASRDDVYFRTVLPLIRHVAENPEAQKLHPTIDRSLQKSESRGFRAYIQNQISKVPLLSASGLYLGEVTQMQVDWSRIESVLQRITKGLFYHHLKRRLPNDHSVDVFSSDTLHLTPEIMNTVLGTLDFVQGRQRYIIGDKVFIYSFRQFQEAPNETFWVLGFFDVKPFWVFTWPPN